MYDQQREDQGNNLLGNVVIGAGLLGAGALAGNYARSVFKNRNRKAQQVNVNAEPPSGQSGTQMRNLSALPEQTKTGVYKRAAESYPDPGVGKDVQYRNPGSGGTDLSMLITDPKTGEIYRRGGGQSANQVRVNQDPGINLAKQNLGGESAPTITDNQYLASIRRSNTRLGDLTAKSAPGFAGQEDYVRNRIAKSLEAPAGSVGPNVQFVDLPPANQLARSTGGEGINNEKAARIARNRAKEVARVSDYMSDVLESVISEAAYTSEAIPSNVLKLAERAGTGTVNQQDFTTFKNWAQGQFKNDPAVLSEITENLYSVLPEKQSTKPAPSSGPKFAGYSEGPVDAQDRKHIEASRRNMPRTMVEVREASAPFARDAANEARLTANDQKDLEIIKLIQRNEDVDLTRFNEDVLDRRVADARDYLIRQEIDTTFDYTAEAERQAAELAAGLERISNDPRRKAAEGIIRELQAEGRAERDLARFQAEGPAGGELAGLKAEDNTRQRENLQGKRSMTGEELEEVLLGESKVIDSNIRGRALRGGKVNDEGAVVYVGEGGAETGDFRDASTGVRTDIKYVASGPKTPEGAASILESEAIRKKYQNQRPEPLRGPAADVARSMEVMRQGMEVEPREVLPSTQVPTINRGGYADGEAVIAVPAETAFTGDAADAAGPVLFTGKNKRDSAVVGTSPPLTQGTVSFHPIVGQYNETMAQRFLDRAIDKGLTEKQSDVYVYEPAKVVKVGSVAAPYLDTGKAAGGPEGVDASQRLGYGRYVIGKEAEGRALPSKPVGTPSTGAMTVGINYAELPSVIDRNRDIGRAPYRGPIQTSAERLAAATGGTARPMSMLPDRGDGRTTISIQPPAYDPRYKTAGARVEKYPAPEAPTRTVYRDQSTGATFVPVEPPKAFELKGPAPIAPDAGPVRMSVPPDPQTQYAPQALAGRQATVVYPRMRGESLNPTGAMINNPDLRGGPVKFEGRERREDEYVRPISERLGRGDTMQRFPLIRRG